MLMMLMLMMSGIDEACEMLIMITDDDNKPE